MTSKTHKQIADEIRALGRPRKSSDPDYAEWISATDPLEFLKRNAQSDEIVMYASSVHLFIMALAVPRLRVEANGIECRAVPTPGPPAADVAFGAIAPQTPKPRCS